ncbi:MAG: iron ABC transporter permease [Acidobacteria bacterium]|nr:MAG: iron ABC transporter permease [Acidobacteriota bacterium]REK02437.1 MAG: iron ABC transporter permease [Acidobacteriota bacterium]REK13762.1 MAG: iron ABC transporter permease [Acidobacteriota bacterium]REK41756.1 MAG: iron ABC transporter permease [Acidobacteriota bacterium]
MKALGRSAGKNKALVYGTGFVVLLVATILIGAALGAEAVSPFEPGESGSAILYEIRLPRVLLGACVGASLAVAGAGLQALLRNPLAEPYLLGVSNGAALGTMLAIILFGSFEFSRPVLAFAGAAAATFAVYQIARSRAGMNAERLILSGVIITTLLSSVIILLTTLLDATKLRSFTFWLLGDLSQATVNGFWICLVSAIVGTILLCTQAKALNLMMVGERDALDFGVEVERTRLLVFAGAAGLVGIAVASSGSVGFVGLIVPHIIRLMVGSDNRLVVPFSALFGASFVVLADTAARTLIAPRELPVGAVTALIGCPLFIWLLRKN